MFTSDRTAVLRGIDERRARGRVLVIDDDACVRSVLGLALREHEVVTAHDGREALALLGQRPDFDLVLCDMVMPTMGGAELWAELATAHPELRSRVVFMTGGVDSTRDRTFIASGEVDVLYKPISTALLRRLARRRVDATASAVRRA
jgi:two-component system, NtrC family, sensor kinase